ncbi:MAG: 50S ribosomal protein L29 [Bacteroidota bacterium]|jgi:large subunit ribosomal protein L29
MKNTEIRELSDKELNGRIGEEKQLLTKMRFSNAVSPLDNPRKIKESKKLIARLLTEQKKRQLAHVQ